MEAACELKWLVVLVNSGDRACVLVQRVRLCVYDDDDDDDDDDDWDCLNIITAYISAIIQFNYNGLNRIYTQAIL